MKFLTLLLTINISLGACFPGFDMSQLVKMVNLMEHYELHQDEAEAIGETLSFLEFMVIHYVDFDNHEHEGEDNHDKLPFQSSSTSLILYCQSIDWEETHSDSNPTQQEHWHCSDFHSNDFQKGVFRPPIFA